MARKPKNKPQTPEPEASKGFDEFLEEESEESGEPIDIDVKASSPPAVKLRDWRDVEKYREERELRRKLGDADLDDF